jgi:hypothetical protein
MPRPAFLGKKNTFVCDVCGRRGNGSVENKRRITCWKCTAELVEAVERKEATESAQLKASPRPRREAISPDTAADQVAENKEDEFSITFPRRGVPGASKHGFFDYRKSLKINAPASPEKSILDGRGLLGGSGKKYRHEKLDENNSKCKKCVKKCKQPDGVTVLFCSSRKTKEGQNAPKEAKNAGN